MKNDHSQTFSGIFFFLQTSFKCKTAEFDSPIFVASCVYLKSLLLQQKRVLLLPRLEATTSATPTLVASFLAKRRSSCRAVFRRRCRSLPRHSVAATADRGAEPRSRNFEAGITFVFSFLSHDNDTNDDFFETNIDFCCCFSFFSSKFSLASCLIHKKFDK